MTAVDRPDNGHKCFELHGAVIHGDPNMPQAARDALAAVVDAVREQFGDPTPEQVARFEAGQRRIRERNARILDTPGCPVHSHGADGWHCAVQGPHGQHRNAAGDVTW